MTAPYPSPETAAHILAEEVLVCERYIDAGHSKAHWRARRNGVLQAAWLLNIEHLVMSKLRGKEVES